MNSAAESASPTPKRRKVRKGTQSCWECKRRKIRCNFAAPTDATCDGCKSRRTRCVGQEFQEETSTKRNKADRLSRVESMVESLFQPQEFDHSTVSQGEAPEDGSSRSEPQEPCKDSRSRSGPRSPGFARATSPNLGSSIQMFDKVDDLSSALLAAWPSEQDLDIILRIPVGVSALSHGVVCQPYSKAFSGKAVSPGQLLLPPRRGSHPVAIARKLLLLGTFLQGIPSSYTGRLADSNADYTNIMTRAFQTASRLVTSNDDFTGSIEGVECIMLESMYQNNAGNLRRAWMANRRAVSAAQMLGLQGGIQSPATLFGDETLERINPEYMWFRLICTDRYLSLMLGLPQSLIENTFVSAEALDGIAPLERLERMEAVAGGLILQRNSSERTDLASTLKIDNMLKEAAALMPPKWWAATSELDATGHDEEAFEETVRLMNHFTHYHIMVQLHLPYLMLSSSTAQNYDYNKLTAASSSRALLTRFVRFRSSSSTTAYCRGVDFTAFIASTALCLVHMEARRPQLYPFGGSVAALDSLQHERMNDRCLLEQTLDIMETLARTDKDAVAERISGILRPLLAIEQKSFDGAHYSVDASEEVDEGGTGCIGRSKGFLHELRIQIPYCGTVKIEHQSMCPDALRPESAPILASSQRDEAVLKVTHQPATWLKALELESTTRSGPGSASRNGERLICSARREQTELSTNFLPCHDSEPTSLGLSDEIDDWALQGVDMALFNNFIQS